MTMHDHDLPTELDHPIRELFALDPEDGETPGLPIREAEAHDLLLVRESLAQALDHVEDEIAYRREHTEELNDVGL